MQQRLVQQASKDYSMRRTITYAMFVCAALFSTCAALAVAVCAHRSARSTESIENTVGEHCRGP